MSRLALLAVIALLAAPADAQFVPNDPLYDSWDPALITTPPQATTPDPSDPGQWNLRTIGADRAWRITTGDSSVVVAVLDYPFRLDHPDLAAALWVNHDEVPGNGLDDDGNGYIDDLHGWDFYADQNTPFVDSLQGIVYTHGTPAAGVIAAVSDNQTGIAGIAGGSPGRPGVRYMPLVWHKVSEGESPSIDSQLRDAVEYAVANGADILSMSFSGRDTPAFYQSLESHASAVFMVASSGNYDPLDRDSTATVRDCEINPGLPADLEGVLGVGATLVDGSRWDGSCPGSDKSRLIDQLVMAPGGEAIIPTTGSDLGYELFSGTSAAAPHVAGVAALLLSVNPSLTPAHLRDAIQQTADPAGCPIDPAISDVRECGHGRVDAYAALVHVLETHGGTLAQDVTIPAGETWSLGDVTLAFAPGTQLLVDGTLNADGTTFTASDPAAGLGRDRATEPGSGGTLTDATITRVYDPNVADPYAIYINDASPTFERVTVDDPAVSKSSVGGFYVTGTQAAPTLNEVTIENMTSTGLLATDGARVNLNHNTVRDNARGVVAGFNADVFMAPLPGGTLGNTIDDNRGVGVAATASGTVTFSSYCPPFASFCPVVDGFNSVHDNDAEGLRASGGGFFAAGGGATNNAVGRRRNRLFENDTHDALVADATSGIDARCNWWGADHANPPFDVAAPAGGYLDVSEWLTLDPGTNPTAPCTSGAKSGLASMSGGRATPTGTSATPATALAAALDRQDPEAAFAALAAIVAAAPETAEGAVALGAVGRLAERADAPDGAGALVRAHTEGGPLRGAARRALVGVLHAAGDLDGALAVTRSVLDDDPSGGDAAFAYVARVYLLSTLGREAEARGAYAALVAQAPRSAEAEVARVRLGLPAEAVEAPEAPIAGASARAATEPEATGVYPNPTAGAATVSFALAEPSAVTVAVYDVLGREVSRTAADYGEGRHGVSVDASRWGPGVYLVRVEAAAEGAAPSVTVHRLTVAR